MKAKVPFSRFFLIFAFRPSSCDRPRIAGASARLRAATSDSIPGHPVPRGGKPPQLLAPRLTRLRDGPANPPGT